MGPSGPRHHARRAMAGDAIDGAAKAFLEELADLTPSPRDRARARKVMEATWRLIDRAQDVLDAKADAELDRADRWGNVGLWARLRRRTARWRSPRPATP
jgi:hypothetical protein